MFKKTTLHDLKSISPVIKKLLYSNMITTHVIQLKIFYEKPAFTSTIKTIVFWRFSQTKIIIKREFIHSKQCSRKTYCFDLFIFAKIISIVLISTGCLLHLSKDSIQTARTFYTFTYT